MRVLLLNGPNLNMLGRREPEIYGRQTLSELESLCVEHGQGLGFDVLCRQSNYEGKLVEWIQGAGDKYNAIIINPGAYTHTSIAILDALLSVDLPTVEVHLSNIHRREDFRHNSYVSKAAWGVICGFGPQGYLMALDALFRRFSPTETMEA
ncbi:type II 3-dehydroquinate dehydratase [Magnetospira sp. QH-2]|uniref:type II 3-dehydroquinate dehydratase n=1 Tax=Magnetospira sp. (strain QH-2) TaxID=1288970 RepID=UPI0003E81924|nr:type II 3-dehydroquinate dehydratase [Magnetospira sp. QH-2]CCQ73225.1 3-dehydroquinate dehydratase type 2 [Magnetospira sp. QH-2]